MPESVPIDQLLRDIDIQPRTMLNFGVVEEYANDMDRGDTLPPVVVYRDDEADGFWLADGWHRVLAAERLDWSEIPAEIRVGTKRDAILFSCGANGGHGVRRTNDDKRRAVKALLKDEEWKQNSDAWIAEQCRVHQTTVSRIRAELEPTQAMLKSSKKPSKSSKVRTTKSGRKMDTSNIGKTAEAEPAESTSSAPASSSVPASATKVVCTHCEGRGFVWEKK